MTSPANITETNMQQPAEKFKGTLKPWVFWPAAVASTIFVTLALVAPHRINSIIQTAKDTLITHSSWYFVAVATGFVLFCIVIAASKAGDIVLGDDDDDPEYSTGSWFAMLFAAGMGIGLVFWGAAEPLSHFLTPPPGTTGDAAHIARASMSRTFLHWGLHAWAIYVVVGLGIAYAVHRKGRPISIRWALEPVLGKYVDSWLGNLIDIFAIIGTLFGVATSLGFGVKQVASGLESMLGITTTSGMLVGLVIVISGLAALSVATGLDAGIKLLSNTNLLIAAFLALITLTLGPTTFLFSEFVQSIGNYLNNLIHLSFQTFAFEPEGVSWLTGWTSNYWGWWISWSPFVGVFIARISRGRTVRQFIVGVMLVPTLVTFLWFSIFGGSALYQEIFEGADFAKGGSGLNTTTALFQMFERLPASSFLIVGAMILVVIFFVTSSDSGSYVLSMISTGGDPNPQLWVRLTWATLSGAIAAALLGSSGSDDGMSALQTMSILSALPFSLVMILICVSLWKALFNEVAIAKREERAMLRERMKNVVATEVRKQVLSDVAQAARSHPIETSEGARAFQRKLLAMAKMTKRPKAATKPVENQSQPPRD
ncbi:BCCT family transporter [Actinomycetaceae bacterium TAE3-ERU4]|nr:BCCT family transporter [Actinomycetaceae bacterium TAE3-ERU4]